MKLYSEALKELEIEQAKSEKKFNNEHSILLMAIHKLYPEIHALVKEEKTVGDIKEKFRKTWAKIYDGFYWVAPTPFLGEESIVWFDSTTDRVFYTGDEDAYHISLVKIISPKLVSDGHNSERAKRESDWQTTRSF